MHKRIPRLIVMVGLSASGKSSYAKELEKENPTNTIVISSDAIREEICGRVEDQSKNGEVFRIFHERIRRNLERKRCYCRCNKYYDEISPSNSKSCKWLRRT